VTLDFSALPGMQSGTLPPGYRAELAYAVTDDVVVLGYGRDFVASVLDATPASSLASNDRFKSLLGRVSAENLGLSFVDLNGIRTVVEPIVKATGTEAWASYEKDIKPYLEHVDAIITSVRKDGSVDRSEAAVTVH